MVIAGSGAENAGEADSLPCIHSVNLLGVSQGGGVTNGNAVCAPTAYAAMIAMWRRGRRAHSSRIVPRPNQKFGTSRNTGVPLPPVKSFPAV